jgi:ribosomal protein S4
MTNPTVNSNLFSNKHVKTSVIKRRFQKLPLELALDNALNKHNAFALEKNRSLDALTEPLLLSAIRARFKSRRLQDLALHVNRRLLPPEQIFPPHMASRRARKRRKARGGLDYFLPSYYEPRTETRWSLLNFKLTVTKKRPSRSLDYTAAGELMLEPSFIIRKRGLAKGFVFSRGKRHMRRFRKRRRYKKLLLKRKRKFKSRRILRRAKWRKKRSLFSFRSLKRLAVRRILSRKYNVARKFGNRLVTATGNTFTLAPLQFVKPVHGVTVSEEEKARQMKGVEVLKQGHYKRASQLATTLTKLFPQMISLIIDRQSGNKAPLDRQVLRGMINSVYWSLRFYLQKDFEGRRLTARDASREHFNLLRGQILQDSEDLYFEAPEFKLMRQRFQPYRIHSVRLLRRASIDWLRMFFPRYHALYLEDPEEYGSFFLTPTQAMRAHPSRMAPGKWSSHKLVGSMENRFKRLTNNSSLENSSRFENILMTSRRAPVIVGCGAAASMRQGGVLGSSLTHKSSFFRRSYSTSFFRAFSSVPVVADRVLKIQRQVVTSNTALSDYTALSVKPVLKTRLYAKSQTSHVEASSSVGVGSIDPRFTRMKSPRNRQFLQRLDTNNYDKTLTLRNANLRTSLYSLETSALKKLYAAERKFIRPTSDRVFANESRHAITVRKNTGIRRAASFLKARAQRDYKRLMPRRSIFSLRKVTQKYNRVNRPRTLGLNFLPAFSKLKTSEMLSKAERFSFVQKTRSILQFRKASHRKSMFHFIKSPTIYRGAVVLRPSVSRFLFSHGVNASMARRILKWRSSNSRGWFRKKSSALEALDLPKRRRYVRLAFCRERQKISFNSGITLRGQRNLRLKNFAKSFKATVDFYKSKPKSVFFVSQARLLYKNTKLTSKFLAAEQRRALVNFGAERRQELWGQITLRWMKKYRFLKNWLKNMKRGLKKINWEYMPELLFKGMRVRLRKLEWREPDRHFNRRGWRNAFSFFPNERKKAPWLERIMFRRSLYSTLRGPYRRYQFPREQKRLNWLQYYRKAIFAQGSKKYIKGRRWPKLRIYNQRLHRGFFSLRNTRVAQRHFKKLSRRKPKGSGFSKSLVGLADRLDVNLVLLNIAPTIFWAKVLASFGVFRVNNKIVCDPTYRFKQNDRIFWNWTVIERLRDHFQRPLRHYDQLRIKNTSVNFPKNFEYFPSVRTAIYKGLPRPEDLQKNSRLTPFLFKMFREDSGSGK